MKETEQNREYEKEFFNSIAIAGHYEVVAKELYDYIFSTLERNNVSVRGKMLEAGCGCGVFGKRFLKRFPDLKVIGVDIAEQMVKRANDGTVGFEAVVGDLGVESMFAENSFDVVLCPAILHHFPDMREVVSNFGKWLRKGGIFIMLEPNGSNIIKKASEGLRKLTEYILGKDFVMKRRIATPNETCHSIRKYEEALLQNNFTITHLSTFHFPVGELKPLSFPWIGETLFRVTKDLFPNSDFFGSGIMIVARKK